MKTAEEWIAEWSETAFRGPNGAADIRLVQQDAILHCAEVIDRLPTNEDRCDQLMLTSQAWDEALEAAASAVRKEIPK